MSTDEFSEFQAAEMEADEVDSLLREQGVGVLSMADGNEAYGIPLSFGYDGSALYFVFLHPGDAGMKDRFAERTQRASFVVFDAPSKHHWRSVIVSGPLSRLDEAEWTDAVAALEANAWFPDLFSKTEPVLDLVGWKLVPDSRRGRKSHGE